MTLTQWILSRDTPDLHGLFVTTYKAGDAYLHHIIGRLGLFGIESAFNRNPTGRMTWAWESANVETPKLIRYWNTLVIGTGQHLLIGSLVNNSLHQYRALKFGSVVIDDSATPDQRNLLRERSRDMRVIRCDNEISDYVVEVAA